MATVVERGPAISPRHKRLSIATATALLLAFVALLAWSGDLLESSREREGRPDDSPAPAAPQTPADPWTYVAMGDSLAAGPGTYVDRYADMARSDAGNDVGVSNIAVPGWTTGDMLRAVRTDQVFRDGIATADLITWNIVGNDLLRARALHKIGTCRGPDNQECLRRVVDASKANWDAILDEIRSLRDPSDAAMRTMNVYNPYVSEDIADGTVQVFMPYLAEVNAHIETTAAAHGILVADVHREFNGPGGDEDPRAKGYIAADGLHPSELGHQVIAEAYRELGYEPLRTGR